MSKAFGEGYKYLKLQWRFFCIQEQEIRGHHLRPLQTSTEDPATGVKEMVPQVSRTTEFARGVLLEVSSHQREPQVLGRDGISVTGSARLF